MALTRDALLERKASLEADRVQLEAVIEQTTADLNANAGAIQQCAWDLEQMDATDEVAPEEDA